MDKEREIQLSKIRPNCRLIVEEEFLLRLCDSIRSYGLHEPIIVELEEYWFKIVDGEKRWRACKRLRMRTIRAIIVR
ncbi:MAG: ParB N-terminal domain-containing protein [Chloroflexi bacterium]|nr:ParB N-terminal domain-containing protein [Chloroflexota bacterium]